MGTAWYTTHGRTEAWVLPGYTTKAGMRHGYCLGTLHMAGLRHGYCLGTLHMAGLRHEYCLHGYTTHV